MLMSTSPPTLRLHSELPITQSRGHFSNLKDFDSLNRAFQLATGWTLGLNQLGKGSTEFGELKIQDLASTSYGRATVGRRYADNLVGEINRLLSAGNGSVANQIDRGEPDRKITIPNLTNFEVGIGLKSSMNFVYMTRRSSNELIDFHAKRNGDHAFLRVRSQPLASLTATMRIRIETAFACLVEQCESASELADRIQSVLWKFGKGDDDLSIDAVLIKDRQFECEIATLDSATLDSGAMDSPCSGQSKQNMLIDFGLGIIRPLELNNGSDACPLLFKRIWVGHGQALVLSNSLGIRSWTNVFGSQTLQRVSSSTASEVAERFVEATCEPGSDSFCPLVIRRK